MGRKKNSSSCREVAQFSTMSNDGWRVKHRVWRDDKFPDAYWHTETRLTDNPAKLFGLYEVYERKFFGKVWIAQRIECKRRTTWIAIRRAILRLENRELEL